MKLLSTFNIYIWLYLVRFIVECNLSHYSLLSFKSRFVVIDKKIMILFNTYLYWTKRIKQNFESPVLIVVSYLYFYVYFFFTLIYSNAFTSYLVTDRLIARKYQDFVGWKLSQQHTSAEASIWQYQYLIIFLLKYNIWKFPAICTPSKSFKYIIIKSYFIWRRLVILKENKS